MPRVSGPARLVAALVFLAVLPPLGAIAWAVLSIRCCAAAGGAEPGAWLVVGAAVLATAAAAAVLAGLAAETLRRLLGRLRKGH